MKVCHVATTLRGGAGIGLWRYHTALLNAGVDSRILVADSTDICDHSVDAFSWKKKSLPVRIAEKLNFPTSVEARIRRRVRRFETCNSFELLTLPFSRYIPEQHEWVRESDIVNIHWAAGVIDWPRFCRSVKSPLVFVLHDQYCYQGAFHYDLDREGNPEMAQIDETLRGVKQACLKGRQIGVVSNSAWNADCARNSVFFNKDTPIKTVYYPLDTCQYRPLLKYEAKKSVGCAVEKHVIGFASEDVQNRRKGFDILIDGVGAIDPGLLSRCQILSFGRCPSRELTSRFDIDWIHLGYLESDNAKCMAYNAMDVFVIPSRAEAFGQTALEATSCKTPVLGSNVGGIPEIVKNGLNGFTFEAGKPYDLSRQLTKLLISSELRASMGDAGRRIAIQRHAPIKLAKELIDFYQLMLSSG